MSRQGNTRPGARLGESWNAGKQQHHQLAKFATGRYDEVSEGSFATGLFKEFEEHRIDYLIEGLRRRALAIDIGCGEGRIAFRLANHFANVVGFDMASGPVGIATKRANDLHLTNVRFEVHDFDSEGLGIFADNSADLVVASFGMGSFSQSLDQLVDEVSRVLTASGRTYLCFYNSEALVSKVSGLEWPLSFMTRASEVDPDRLIVTVDGNEFHIAGHTYDTDEISHAVGRKLRRVEVDTFPAVSGVLPQAILESNPAVRESVANLDRMLAPRSSVDLGFYIVCTARQSD